MARQHRVRRVLGKQSKAVLVLILLVFIMFGVSTMLMFSVVTHNDAIDQQTKAARATPNPTALAPAMERERERVDRKPPLEAFSDAAFGDPQMERASPLDDRLDVMDAIYDQFPDFFEDEPATLCPRGLDKLTVSVQAEAGQAVLSNGYVCVVLGRGVIHEARADFHGKGNWGRNVLGPRGVTLATDYGNRVVYSSTESNSSGIALNVQEASAEAVTVVMLVPNDYPPIITEKWTVTIKKNERSFLFETMGSVVSEATTRLVSIRRDWQLRPSSIYAWYAEPDSVVQMKAARRGFNFFATQKPLQRFYALGGLGPEKLQVGSMCLDWLLEPESRSEPRQTVLVSNDERSDEDFPWVDISGFSGFQEVLLGKMEKTDLWTEGWAWQAAAAPQFEVMKWSQTARVGINSLDFPVAKLGTGPNLPLKDLHSTMMAIYASPVGCLVTHINAVVYGERLGQIATTIARPDRGYEGTYNYFDPDNYLSVSAMLWSNERFLQEQVRFVLERNGQFLLSNGQLPHHFQGATPTYVALSGELQTGPNVFWILSCFNYARATQNIAWLRGYMPIIRHASNFLLNLIDYDLSLAKVSGSLMIDVFLRWGYTSDTNAELVGFLRAFAAAEQVVGNTTGSAKLLALSDSIAKAVNTYLWQQDHYVTQWDGLQNGSFRDFVDYDANMIALAHGIPSEEQAAKLFQRIDNGTCRAAATWVSERWYGPEDTKNRNIGDSCSGMGRIAWFEALGRRRYDDLDGFNNRVMEPLQRELLSTLWMHERIGCNGLQQQNRTAMYFEYPSLIAMVLREVRYGVDLQFETVSVRPFGVSEFSYHINDVDVDFSRSLVRLRLPGTGMRRFTLAPLEPSTAYKVSLQLADRSYAGGAAVQTPCENKDDENLFHSDKDGVLTFTAALGRTCVIHVAKKTV